MQIEILHTDIALKTMLIKIESSLEDFKANTPHRKDIIESMSDTLKDLRDIKTMYEFLKNYYESNDVIMFHHTKEIEKLRNKNRQLQGEIQAITKNLEI